MQALLLIHVWSYIVLHRFVAFFSYVLCSESNMAAIGFDWLRQLKVDRLHD